MKKIKSHSKKKKTATRKSTFPHKYFVIVAASLVLLFAAANIQTTQVLSSNTHTSVLGEDEIKTEENKQEDQEENNDSGNKRDEQKKSEEQRKEFQEKQKEQQKEFSKSTSANSLKSSTNLFKIKTETTASNGSRMKTKSETDRQETEMETVNGQKVKTKAESNGTTKVEIKQEGFRLKYVIENGKTVLKVENEDGNETDVSDDKLFELKNEAEQELEDQDVEISSQSGRISFSKNNVTATTKFPLSINVITKQLVVTTPAGEKVVSILPDQAIENLLATGVVNKIDEASSSENLENLDGNIKIELRNGEAVYKVKGHKTKKIFGVIPMSTPVTAFISTESGIPLETQQSILSRIINSLSL